MRGSRFHGGCRDELSDTPVQMPVHMLWGRSHPCLYETAFVSNFPSSMWKQPRSEFGKPSAGKLRILPRQAEEV
ncbi:hypothetical protein MHYP_G00284150 [Metynnis hypsauchen]